MSAAPAGLDGEIKAALSAHGLRARRIALISPLEDRKGRRLAYRVDAEGGGTVKVRHFESDEEAQRLCELAATLEPAFAPVLARHGSVVFEEWIEGEPLADGEAEARVEEAGALFGRLHAAPLGTDVPGRRDSDRWVRDAESDLGILAGAGRLSDEEAGSLLAEIRRLDPGSGRSALIHRDFCVENLLIDGQGRLRVIDNEWLMIGPAEWDLGRTHHRWPMSEAAWERFCGAYSAVAGEPEWPRFWALVAAAFGARVCHQMDPARLDSALALLRSFILR